MDKPSDIISEECRKKKKKTTSIEDAAILITKSVQDVIECSKDDNFKRRCLKAINVDDFEELERKTNRKLKKLLKTRCGYSRKREGQDVSANENCANIINENQRENSQSNYTPIRKRNRSEPLQQFSKNTFSSPRRKSEYSLNGKQQNTLTTQSNNLTAIETQQTATQSIRIGNEKNLTEGNEKYKLVKTPEKITVNIRTGYDGLKTPDMHTADLSNHTQQKVDLSLLCDFINGANDELTEWLSPNTKYRSPSIYPQSGYNIESLNGTPLNEGNSKNLYEKYEGEAHGTYSHLQKDVSLVNSDVDSLEDSISVFPNSFVNTNLDISSCFKKIHANNAIKNDVKLPLSVNNYTKDSNFSFKNDSIVPLSVSNCNANNNYNMQNNNISECRDLNIELLDENVTDCSDVTQSFYTDTIQTIFENDKDEILIVNNKLKEIFETNHIVPDIDNNIEDWLGEFENDEFWCQSNDSATNENDVFRLPTEELFRVDDTKFNPCV